MLCEIDYDKNRVEDKIIYVWIHSCKM